jgi:DNA polymerase delta subunit 4
MPTTRRSTRSSTGAGKQQTLSFKHKVTKAIKTGKEGYKSPARAKEYIPEPTPEPTTTKQEDDEEVHTSATSDDEHEHEHEHEQPAQATAAEANTKSDEETQAAQITDRAIERYWAGIEASRSAKAVHKKHGEGLTTGEKVLRYFDVSSQYGVRIILLSAP